MNFATIIGIPLGVGLLILAYLMEGGDLLGLLRPSTIIIIIGGTLGAVMASFDMSDIRAIPKILRTSMRMVPGKEKDLGLRFIALAEKSRRDGLLSLEEDMQAIDARSEGLLKKGLRYVIDGTDSEALREILESDITIFEKRRKREAEIFESAGGYSPTMGIIGTVLGLTIVLKNLAEPEKLGEAISVAFIATLFGIALANLVWLPISTKLKVVLAHEKNIMEMIVVGVLAIQQGESPKLVGDKLAVYLPEKDRPALEYLNEV